MIANWIQLQQQTVWLQHACHMRGEGDGGQIANAIEEACCGGRVPVQALEELCDAPLVQAHPYPHAAHRDLQKGIQSDKFLYLLGRVEHNGRRACMSLKVPEDGMLTDLR